MKEIHQNIDVVRRGICSVSGAAQQLCTKTMWLLCATQPSLQLVLPHSYFTRELRRLLLGACLSPVSILRPCAFLGGSIPSFTNICLGALDFLLLLVWGQMKTLSSDACTQMNSQFQASSLHSFCCLWLGCVWTLQKKEVEVLFPCIYRLSKKKKNPNKAAATSIAPKGTRRGGLFSHASTNLQSLKKKGRISPRSSGIRSLSCVPAGATSPLRVMLNFTVWL